MERRPTWSSKNIIVSMNFQLDEMTIQMPICLNSTIRSADYEVLAQYSTQQLIQLFASCHIEPNYMVWFYTNLVKQYCLICGSLSCKHSQGETGIGYPLFIDCTAPAFNLES